MDSARSAGRVEAVGPLFLEPAVLLVDDELPGFVRAGFLDAGADSLGFCLEGCEAVLTLSLEVPFAIGRNDVITDALGP